jgi:hypothetical protein
MSNFKLIYILDNALHRLWYKILFKQFFSYHHEGWNAVILNKLYGYKFNAVDRHSFVDRCPTVLEKAVPQPKNPLCLRVMVCTWGGGWGLGAGEGDTPPPLHRCLPTCMAFQFKVPVCSDEGKYWEWHTLFSLSSYLYGSNSSLPPSHDTATNHTLSLCLSSLVWAGKAWRFWVAEEVGL